MAVNVKFLVMFTCSQAICWALPSADSAENTVSGQGNSTWNPAWSLTFPDRPLQLVRPDYQHKILVLDEENIKILHHMRGAVATVAVVGKFHSGKSFLLNQLMGKVNGFGIGPYVKPQTMGIWMWGKPLVMKMDSGDDMSVIFLDTEGFAATNVSENYDAKIFAVATLLSSYLIYNSVKIIDQSDIDYLEALARRTQLFALRSQMSKAKWTHDFNHDLLSFPPLLWVVQDFVQMTENGESPQQWLHRLMTTHARENEDYEISLLGIFKSVECQTLFLPAVKKSLLSDLSRATEADLTEEYRQERDQLIDILRRSLKPKEKNDQPITGPEIATLLEILVKAANEGSLAEIPSRWDTFIERLEDGATEDCLLFYEVEMNTLFKKHQDQPVNPLELEQWHQMSFNQSLTLLQQLLFGLKDTVKEASKLLRKGIMEKYTRTRELNVKKIKLKCSEMQHQLELSAEEHLLSVNLPVASSELKQIITAFNSSANEKYASQVRGLLNITEYEVYSSRLQSSITNIGETFLLKNKQSLEKMLDEAVTEAVGLILTKVKIHGVRPLTPVSLEHELKSIWEEASLLFTSHTAMAQSEAITDVYRGMLKAQFADESQKATAENERNLQQAVVQKTTELIDMFRSYTEPAKLSLPMNETDLDYILFKERDRCCSILREEFKEFSSMKAFTSGLEQLSQDVENLITLRRRDNVEAFTREVSQPLNTAKQVIMLSADKLHTVFSLRQYIQKVCLLNLNEGKAKTWPISFKQSVINHYMKTDHELVKLVASKEGVWSTVVGFFHWLLWLIGF